MIRGRGRPDVGFEGAAPEAGERKIPLSTVITGIPHRYFMGAAPGGIAYPNCSTVVTMSKSVWLQAPSPTRAHVGCFSPKRGEYHPR